MRYQDYVIKDGRLVGQFEEMYRDVPDPWHCTESVNNFKNHMLLGAVRSLPDLRQALDVGCGQGALSHRLKGATPETRWQACDISETAVSIARRQAGVDFFVHDVLTAPLPLEEHSLDLVTMSEVLWYLLPGLKTILQDFRRVLKPRGALLIMQYFLAPEEQKYGREWISQPSDVVRYLGEAGFTVEQEVYLGPTPPNDLMVLARC